MEHSQPQSVVISHEQILSLLHTPQNSFVPYLTPALIEYVEKHILEGIDAGQMHLIRAQIHKVNNNVVEYGKQLGYSAQNGSLEGMCLNVRARLMQPNTDINALMVGALKLGMTMLVDHRICFWAQLTKCQTSLKYKLMNLVLREPQSIQRQYLVSALRLAINDKLDEWHYRTIIKLAETNKYPPAACLVMVLAVYGGVALQNIEYYMTVVRQQEFWQGYFVCCVAQYRSNIKAAIEIAENGWQRHRLVSCSVIHYQLSFNNYNSHSQGQLRNLLNVHFILLNHRLFGQVAYILHLLSKYFKLLPHQMLIFKQMCRIRRVNQISQQHLVYYSGKQLLQKRQQLETIVLNRPKQLNRVSLYLLAKTIRKCQRSKQLNAQAPKASTFRIQLLECEQEFMKIAFESMHTEEYPTIFYRVGKYLQKGFGSTINLTDSYALYLKVLDSYDIHHQNPQSMLQMSFKNHISLLKASNRLKQLSNKQQIINYKKQVIQRFSTKQCSICMSTTEEQYVMLFPCRHIQGQKCIIKHLRSYKNNCPLCRSRVFMVLSQQKFRK